MLYAGVAVVASALLLAPGGPDLPGPSGPPGPPASCVVPVGSSLLSCPPDGRREHELPQSCVVPVIGRDVLPADPLIACPRPPLFPKGRTLPVVPATR